MQIGKSNDGILHSSSSDSTINRFRRTDTYIAKTKPKKSPRKEEELVDIVKKGNISFHVRTSSRVSEDIDDISCSFESSDNDVQIGEGYDLDVNEVKEVNDDKNDPD